MGWFASLWAWIAQHPFIVFSVVAGLAGIIVVWWERRPRWWPVAQLPNAEKTDRPPVLASAVPSPRIPQAGATPAEIQARQEEIRAGREEFWRKRRATPQGAFEIEAGRLAYRIHQLMWVGVRETVEVRLGRLIATEFMLGFVGRGDIKLEHVPIVETMSVSLACEPSAFDIEPRSQEVQLVKPDLVKGTAFHQADFGKWVWLVTPRETGEHTLLVKVSAAMKDSRGLPTTAALPDKIIAVTVRVHLVRATVGAVARVAPGLAWAVVTALVGVFTKDYWWPALRNMLGM